MAATRRPKRKPHVPYLGDWAFHMGPMFAETPFNVVQTKDADLPWRSFPPIFGYDAFWQRALSWVSRK